MEQLREWLNVVLAIAVSMLCLLPAAAVCVWLLVRVATFSHLQSKRRFGQIHPDWCKCHEHKGERDGEQEAGREA